MNFDDKLGQQFDEASICATRRCVPGQAAGFALFLQLLGMEPVK
jgi:hypothetical protein